MTTSTVLTIERTGQPLTRRFALGVNCLSLQPDPAAQQAPPPMILFLHGIGERGRGGDDLERVHRWGLPKLRSTGSSLSDGAFPFLVIAPQCPPHRTWCDEDVLRAIDRLLDEVVASRLADPRRLIVAGFSMGAIGSFCLALRHPRRFAALVSVCGRCPIPDVLPELAALPTWIAYAEDDASAELTAGSQLAIDVLAPFGNVVPRAYRLGAIDHMSAHVRTADAAFAEAELYRWLARQQQAVQPPERS